MYSIQSIIPQKSKRQVSILDKYGLIHAVTDLLEVPGLGLLLVLASDALILDPQLREYGPQIRTLSRIHLHIHLLVGQSRLEGAHLLQSFKAGKQQTLFNSATSCCGFPPHTLDNEY